MVKLYKLIIGKYENNTSKFVKLYSEHNALSDRTREHCWKVCKERNRLHIRNESFPQLWNCLPEDIVRGANVDSFKNRLDRHWSREPIVYDYRAPNAGTTPI